jgi:Ca-activated chloride channel family protein
MTFGNPQMLWLLLVFPPAMLAFFWWAWRQRQALMTQFIQARLLSGLTVGISTSRQKLRLAGVALSVVCLIVALARPQWGFDWQEAKQRGLDIVVAIDTSKSMLAEDIAPNRLGRAKLAALDLMQQARSDRLGLVAFAGSAFLQCPLTIDDAAFRQSVQALDVNVIPQGGTALAEAIETALTAFKEADNHKVLVLMTDGEDHDSGALEAAKKAAESGLKIFTIGIGSKEGELLRVKDAKGRTDYIRDEQGNVVKSHLNEGLLQEIAGATKAVYFPLRGAKTVDTLYRDWLAPLPKTDSEEKLIKQPHERYHWPLALAILLLVAEILLPERKREPKARAVGATLARAAASGAVALLIFMAMSATGRASPGSALREYKAGKYDQALKEYEQLLERKADDPRLRFNAGAAAYRNGRFDEAAKHFEAAAVSPDLSLQEQAYYNRGNTFYHLGENNPDPAQRTETWKKAVEDYQNSLNLNPQDTDAKFNYEFVKKKIEELKQQQQQSQQNKSDQNKDQDQNQDQQQQQQQDQQKQDSKKDQEQKSQQQDQNKSEQKQDSAKQNQDGKKEEEKKQQAAKKEQQKKDEQEKQQKQAKQAKASKGSPDDKSDEQQTAAAAAGQMTPEQAQQLLDTQKGDEQMLPSKPNAKPVDPSRPVKDW